MDKEEVETQKLATIEIAWLIDADDMSTVSNDSIFVAI